MLDPRVTFHWMSRTNYLNLDPADRLALEEVTARLAGTDPAGWPDRGYRHLPGDPPYYLVPVTPFLRAMVTPTPGGGVEVRHITNVEALKMLAPLRDGAAVG